MSIKVANFDLGIAQEDYAIKNAKKYGGGALIGRYFKEYEGFHLFALAESFENLDENDRKENCFILSPEIRNALIRGYPIDSIFPNINDYDLILHGHTHFSFNRTNNLKIPIVHWAGFAGDCGHPNNDYILLYRKVFKAEYGEKAKYVKIGKDVPKDFIEYNNRDGIFQCTQLSTLFGAPQMAQECLKYGIKGIFAGPIKDNLLDYIDNKTTFYLGIISEKEKLEYTQKARLYTLNLDWDVVFNQSAIEANGLGTPILVSKRGWFNEYVQENINGFFYNNDNFLESYQKAGNINQKDCWSAAKEHSIEEVTRTFYNAFNEIKNENIARK